MNENKGDIEDVPPPPYTACSTGAEESTHCSDKQNQQVCMEQPISPGYVGSPGMPTQMVYVQGYPAQSGPVMLQYPVVPAQPLLGSTVSEPREVMLLAILATAFCFFPTGIMAVMKASEAKSAYVGGDLRRANKLSRRARKYINLSIVLGIVCYVIVIIILVVVPIWFHETYLKNF